MPYCRLNRERTNRDNPTVSILAVAIRHGPVNCSLLTNGLGAETSSPGGAAGDRTPTPKGVADLTGLEFFLSGASAGLSRAWKSPVILVVVVIGTTKLSFTATMMQGTPAELPHACRALRSASSGLV